MVIPGYSVKKKKKKRTFLDTDSDLFDHLYD